MGKKALCLIFAFLLNINSFAAVVADNDGSAFVTKAEFEALKDNFSSQVDNYNTSIDSKVDGAISSYLAGVQLQKETWVESNIDVLDYPLTIIDKQKIIDECTTSNTNKSEQTSLWTPGFTFFAVCWRAGVLTTEKYEKTQVDNIQYFLNGTANTTNGTFKVTDICYKPKITWQNAFIHEDCPAADGWGDGTEYFCNVMFLDADGNPTGTNDGTYTNRTVLANYAKLWNTTNYNQHVTCWHAAGLGDQFRLVTTDVQARYDKHYNGGYHLAWYQGNGFLSAWAPDDNFAKTYEYSNMKLDRIYNYGVSGNNSHFAPTTQNNVLYFTNKKANRHAYTPNKKIAWLTRSTDTYSRKTMKWCISSGENLEHEAEDTGRSWNNKSLISANRIVYDFDTPDGGQIANHKMVNGIPIFFVSKDFRTEAVQGLKIEFNLTTTRTANPKYIIISKKPITTQVYSDNVESNADYATISKINGTYVNAKKGTITNGKNTIEIKDDVLFDLNDVVYMKILWDDNNVVSSAYDESVIITKPKIGYKAAS